jgi:hypothetical protein
VTEKSLIALSTYRKYVESEKEKKGNAEYNRKENVFNAWNVKNRKLAMVRTFLLQCVTWILDAYSEEDHNQKNPLDLLLVGLNHNIRIQGFPTILFLVFLHLNFLPLRFVVVIPLLLPILILLPEIILESPLL